MRVPSPTDQPEHHQHPDHRGHCPQVRRPAQVPKQQHQRHQHHGPQRHRSPHRGRTATHRQQQCLRPPRALIQRGGIQVRVVRHVRQHQGHLHRQACQRAAPEDGAPAEAHRPQPSAQPRPEHQSHHGVRQEEPSHLAQHHPAELVPHHLFQQLALVPLVAELHIQHRAQRVEPQEHEQSCPAAKQESASRRNRRNMRHEGARSTTRAVTSSRANRGNQASSRKA